MLLVPPIDQPLPLIPMPAVVRRLDEPGFELKKDTIFVASGPAQGVADRFSNWLKLGHVVAGGPQRGTVTFRIDANYPNWGPEDYSLRINRDGVAIVGKTTAGLFYATQTIRQLLPKEVETSKRLKSATLPALEIEDHPRFGWRGMHLDVSRHFFNADEIKRYLDYLALHKFNVFHWHLVDDGGWRVEIKKYPRLTQVGAWRDAVIADGWSQRGLRFPEPSDKVKRYGGFYTQKQIRDIVKYAADRNITVVPEIELPGHTQPSIAAYPQLACEGYDPKAWLARSGNQIANVYCAGKEESFQFLENVLDEVCRLFPSQFIHIGGDEVDKYLWANCPRCKDRMAKEGLKDTQELQSYFIQRVEKMLNARGKRLIGWDEILEGGLAPNATVMSWRGEAGGVAAAKAGHDVVMSPTTPCYFDYSYQDNSTQRVFEYEPVPPELRGVDESKRVLGAQGNVWTEWMPKFTRVEEMIFPRMLALSEVLWHAPDGRDFAEFQQRLGPEIDRVVAMGGTFMLPAPAASATALFLDGPQAVGFTGSAIGGAVLHYTLDGKDPSATSAVYGGPQTIQTPGLIKGAFVLPNGKVGPITTISVGAIPGTPPPGLQQGLVRQAFNWNGSVVPDFEKLQPIETTGVDQVGLDTWKGKVNYALRLFGYLQIDKPGSYAFRLSSDDGSWMKLNGLKIVDNDGLHGTVPAVGSVKLPAGVYPLEIGFFQAGGADSLSLDVSIDGGAFIPVPADWLRSRRLVGGKSPMDRGPLQ